MANSALTKRPKATPAYFRSEAVQASFSQWMSNPDDRRAFTAELIGVLDAQPALQDCDAASVASSAITAVSLDLPITAGLGYAGIVPYRDNKAGTIRAQFQVMAKGFKQLALRTGNYTKMNDTDVRDGEYLGEDRMTGDHKFAWIEDDTERRKKKIVGYLAYLRLKSGFEKTLYMTIDDLEKHAKKYSKSYGRGSGKWADKTGDGFDQMARKTVVKLLISRHGVTSRNLQRALCADQAELFDAEIGRMNYVDNKPNSDDTPIEGEVVEDGK